MVTISIPGIVVALGAAALIAAGTGAVLAMIDRLLKRHTATGSSTRS